MLDHLVLATPDLARTVDDLAARGVFTVDGGPHVGVGTRNRLAGIGPGRYLEVVGPDPEQPEPAAPRPFGIDTLTASALVTWAVRVDDLDAALEAARCAGHDPGEPREMSRRRPDGELLSWRLAFPPDSGGGVLPFLIEWGSTRHPSDDLPVPASLDVLRLTHPAPARVTALLDALGEPRDLVEVVVGERPGLAAALDKPHGALLLD
ncbi:VOC family protein [Pseudonocardia phyllosphaerae]|uniref:VOC family protein n=1 Tax=Pseudonocardia phyllosphaerae TaxID=3390502 RepID=UPI00397AFE1B